MHYYNFNIADYRKDTQHLTAIEHYIYRELIDWYYLDEKPIPKKTQWVLRRLRLGSDDAEKLLNVLQEFFDEREDGWFHGRIEEEIDAYRKRAERARVNGIKGGRPKKPKNNRVGFSGLAKKTQGKANQEPITNNQDNPPMSPPCKAQPVDNSWKKPDWVNAKAWAEFEQHRREIRKPMSNMARTKAANQLKALTPEQQQDCVDMTIQNRWQGLFPGKVKNGTGQDQPASGGVSRAKRHADKLDEIARRDIAKRGGITRTLG